MDCFINTDKWYFKKWQNFGIDKYCQNSWQFLRKTVIFGNNCQVWQHLAALSRCDSYRLTTSGYGTHMCSKSCLFFVFCSATGSHVLVTTKKNLFRYRVTAVLFK